MPQFWSEYWNLVPPLERSKKPSYCYINIVLDSIRKATIYPFFTLSNFLTPAYDILWFHCWNTWPENSDWFSRAMHYIPYILLIAQTKFLFYTLKNVGVIGFESFFALHDVWVILIMGLLWKTDDNLISLLDI